MITKSQYILWGLARAGFSCRSSTRKESTSPSVYSWKHPVSYSCSCHGSFLLPCVHINSKTQLEKYWEFLCKFQGLEKNPLSYLFHPLGSWFHLLSDPSFIMKGSTCLQLSSFITLLPASRILGVWQPSFI